MDARGAARAGAGGPLPAQPRRRPSEQAPREQATVLPGGELEIVGAELHAGRTVDVVVLREPGATAARSIMEALTSGPERGLPQPADEVRGARSLAVLALTLAVAVALLTACEGGSPSPTPASTPTPAGETPAERDALTALYHATNGPEWTNSDGWLNAVPLGEWRGVMTDDEGRVTGLNLRNNGLRGELPPQLGDLVHLEALRLNRNELSGAIPPELGNLANLTDLRLNRNELSGPIPPQLGDLVHLTELRLNQNQLSGEIPQELGNLTNLERLLLDSNRLSGPIPPELGNLTKLEQLALGSNRLSGAIPPQLGDLTKLEQLALGSNQLSGAIPPQLGNLTSLGQLTLASNELSGPIPPQLGNLTSLEWLSLGVNRLSGAIPPQLGNLTRLEGLVLGVNQLSGAIPGQLGNLTNLQRLALEVNQLSGAIPTQLGNLTSLQSLSLEENRLSGSIPAQLGNLANLASLTAYRNELSGELAPQLANLASLQVLRLGDNNLSGEVPPWLGSLAELTSLRLHANGLSGAIPAELGNLAKLEILWLSYNRLTGEIPPELGDLAALEELWLGGNQLSGRIPAELGNLTKLTTLELAYNLLNGEIPPELGNLANLERLWLQENGLSGEIPAELGDLANLSVLWVHGNLLTGELPAGALPVRVGPAAEETGPSSRTPVAVALHPAFGGREFDQPVEIGVYPVGPDGRAGPAAFVADREGRVLLLHPAGREAVEMLDITDRVSMAGNEEGLLSVALDPRFEETGHLWLYYSPIGSPRVTRLSRFAVDPADLRRVDPRSELVVMEVDQPYSQHNGGGIRFGSDGMLYLGLGDGGLSSESQDLGTVLGSVIRIDVRDASAASPYAIPRDNPFVDVAGARPEIWAYGFRNPWRMAFDPATGVLWAGDVGGDDIEEIDRVEAGGNYGWDRLEGTRCPRAECDPDGTILPVVEYGHHLGCSVTGGVVYRGEAIPELVGHYLFSDFCRGQIWALPLDGGDVMEIAVSERPVASFGVDADGEVYVLTFWGAVLRLAPPGW